MEIAAAGEDHKRLRKVAAALLNKAETGDVATIKEIADRLDGKPAQESTATVGYKRDATDLTRDELIAFINDAITCGASEDEDKGENSDKSDPEPPEVVH